MQSKNYAAGPKSHLLASNDPFWPSIDLVELRANLLLTSLISDARLEVAAQVATHKVAGEFAQWRRVLRARGFKRLEDLASHQQLSRCYRCAVEAHAKQALAHNVHVVERQAGANGGVAYE